ncbi:MAG: chromosomal replication initiator protein DnaA [Planctomycetota bacterium]
MADASDVLVWERIHDRLRATRPDLCRQWFDRIEPAGLADGRLYLRTATRVQRDYLRRACAEPFSEAAQDVTGYLLAVRFLDAEETPPASEGRPSGPRQSSSREGIATTTIEQPKPNPVTEVEPKPVHAAPGPAQPRPEMAAGRQFDGIAINPDYEFENFVIGPNNRLAHAASVAVASNPARAYNPLFIHGGVGLGKTHLLQAICLTIARDNPNAVICYLSCDAFIAEFMEAVQAGEMSGFRHRFREADLLVIDDIHFLSNRERTQEEFFHTFNSLYPEKQIVLSSDAPPGEIPALEDRLVSRFQWGLVTDIQPPSYETRVAILQTKARLRGIELSNDVASFVAQRHSSNIRQLEGAISQLQLHALADQSDITVDLAKQALGAADVPRSGVAPTVQQIIEHVSGYYSVKPSELLSKRRTRSVAIPRQVCMFLARRLTRHSLEEIGVYLGNRDHTTVMHAVKQIETRCKSDADFGRTLEQLERDLHPVESE